MVSVAFKAWSALISKRRPLQTQVYLWARFLHVYISMGTLILVLFFSLTGLTLNHPDLMFGSQIVRKDYSGNLPLNWLTTGQIDWLNIVEYLRSDYAVHGQVSDYRHDEYEGQIRFNAPGYSANVFFNLESGSFSLNTDSQGWVAVLNDLHRGRDTSKTWNWLIDLSAIFLVLVSLTGLALLLVLKKMRPKALVIALGGSMLSIVIMILAVW